MAGVGGTRRSDASGWGAEASSLVGGKSQVSHYGTRADGLGPEAVDDTLDLMHGGTQETDARLRLQGIQA